MKRIIIHWTGGSYEINQHILDSYHYVVTKDGGIIPCNHRPEDNENCQDGNYAAHTGGGNTGSIGVAMLGMYYTGKQTPKDTKYPLTKVQVERCFKLCAELCDKYDIKPSPDTVLTHYEFGKKNPNTSSSHKPDIVFLPPYSWIEQDDVGKFIRTKVRWYLQQIKK